MRAGALNKQTMSETPANKHIPQSFVCMRAGALLTRLLLHRYLFSYASALVSQSLGHSFKLANFEACELFYHLHSIGHAGQLCTFMELSVTRDICSVVGCF